VPSLSVILFFWHLSILIRLLSQIALGVIISWGRTIYQEFELLAGKSAPHEFLQLVIYKAATFTDEIEKVDTVRAYHVRRFRPSFFILTKYLFRVDQ
jgi:hypothetical protein